MPKAMIVQTEPEVPAEILAQSIVDVAEAVKKLRATRLNERALFLLIQHAAPNPNGKRSYGRSPLSIKQIQAVFEGIESLEREYLKPRKVPGK